MEQHRFGEAVEALQTAEALEAHNRDIARQLRLAREHLAQVTLRSFVASFHDGDGTVVGAPDDRRASAPRMIAIASGCPSPRSRSSRATCPPRVEPSLPRGTLFSSKWIRRPCAVSSLGLNVPLGGGQSASARRPGPTLCSHRRYRATLCWFAH